MRRQRTHPAVRNRRREGAVAVVDHQGLPLTEAHRQVVLARDREHIPAVEVVRARVVRELDGHDARVAERVVEVLLLVRVVVRRTFSRWLALRLLGPEGLFPWSSKSGQERAIRASPGWWRI